MNNFPWTNSFSLSVFLSCFLLQISKILHQDAFTWDARWHKKSCLSCYKSNPPVYIGLLVDFMAILCEKRNFQQITKYYIIFTGQSKLSSLFFFYYKCLTSEGLNVLLIEGTSNSKRQCKYLNIPALMAELNVCMYSFNGLLHEHSRPCDN